MSLWGLFSPNNHTYSSSPQLVLSLPPGWPPVQLFILSLQLLSSDGWLHTVLSSCTSSIFIKSHVMSPHYRQSLQCSDLENNNNNKVKLERDQFPTANSSVADQLNYLNFKLLYCRLNQMGMLFWLLELFHGDNSQLGLSVGIALNV